MLLENEQRPAWRIQALPVETAVVVTEERVIAAASWAAGVPVPAHQQDANLKVDKQLKCERNKWEQKTKKTKLHAHQGEFACAGQL